jgi:hypothetical protein
MPRRTTSKMQAIASQEEAAQCEKCGIIYQGMPGLIKMKMRLHEKTGCDNPNTEHKAVDNSAAAAKINAAGSSNAKALEAFSSMLQPPKGQSKRNGATITN